MSTVADDLLNDFGSSGDEAEDQEHDGLAQTGDATTERDANAMDVDGDQDDDEEAQNGVADLNDAEATKAKVEKMQLGAVKDVRSVASLMQTLEPVLEVSDSLPPRIWSMLDEAFTSFEDISLTYRVVRHVDRKSNTSVRNQPRRRGMLATSRIIQSIIFSHSPTVCPPRSMAR